MHNFALAGGTRDRAVAGRVRNWVRTEFALPADASRVGDRDSLRETGLPASRVRDRGSRAWLASGGIQAAQATGSVFEGVCRNYCLTCRL